jgi:predicted alpha/beta-fold hydrolase
MWESLASSRREDRVLHGAAKALNVILSLFALPLWLVGQRLSTPLRRALARIDPYREALPVPAPRERSMDALMGDLERIPSRLHPSAWAQVRKGLPDLTAFVLAQHHEGANLGYAYPRQFTDHVFVGADDERIAAVIGLHAEPRPGLIVVHGLFSSRRFDYVREIAVRAFFDWGFSVAAVDLRSFGLTNMTSQAPSSIGWKEGEDLIAAGRYLKDLGATSVGALGISLGGSAVLGACHPEGADEALDGGIIAISPPADTREMAERLSRRVPLTHPAYAMRYGFRAMLTSRVREARWPIEVSSYLDPVEKVFAPYYGVEPEELWGLSSARNHIDSARVPVLVLHPEDDYLIPVEHARVLEEAASGNDNVRVWILPGGAHGAIDAVDRRWAYGVYRTFFERWARYAERGEAPDGHAPAPEVVYSPGSQGKLDFARES